MKWVRRILFFLGLLALAWSTKTQEMPPLPTDVKVYKSVETTKGSQRQLQIANSRFQGVGGVVPEVQTQSSIVVPPKTFTIKWCDQNLIVQNWEVWHTFDMTQPFTFLAIVTAPSYSKPADALAEFFKVRGVLFNNDGTKTFSGWATYGTCP